MAVALYGDESESSESPRLFTLAAFVASNPTGWIDLVPAWQKMLCATGPYPVDAFHANAVEQGNPPFDGWSPDQRRTLVDRAVEILADTTLSANLYAMGCTFVLDDLNALIPASMGNGEMPDIYERAYRVLLMNINQFSQFRGIDVVFDKKKKAEGRVQRHFQTAKAACDASPKLVGLLNTCSFADDRTVVPLQAADLLAYELRRRVWDRLRDPSTPVRPAYQRLKTVFKLIPESAPPYRARNFRCYDARFVADLQREVVARQPITAEEAVTLWYYLPVAED
jgi:Protein of unknown function (DUF3800)